MMAKILISEYKSPIGPLLIGSLNGKLCLCDWRDRKGRFQVDNRLKIRLNALFDIKDCEFNQQVITQLEQYFAKEREHFDLPLLLAGTEFQQKVWCGLMGIPYGETLGYGELASSLEMTSAVRAVANATGANAISIVVPCHRIIGNNGKLTGYAGGLAAKKQLLSLEVD